MDGAWRISIVVALWIGIYREWSLSGGDAFGLVGRIALLLVVTSWAIRAYRFRGR